MVRVCTLYSGSSANCTFVEADGRAVLIDAGAGVRKTGQALEAVGSCYEKIEAIFITHEHSDHIAGLQTITKYYNIPIISNRKTLCAIKSVYPDIDEDLFHEMPTGSRANNGVMQITSFATLHDSAECVGYIINTGNRKIGVMTDVGEETAETSRYLSSCDTAVVEANHDENQLWNGSYSYSLKQRIGGKFGHFSNNQCGRLLEKTIARCTQNVILAHLSKENNTPELAYDTVRKYLTDMGISVGTDVRLSVAPRSDVSEIVTYT